MMTGGIISRSPRTKERLRQIVRSSENRKKKTQKKNRKNKQNQTGSFPRKNEKHETNKLLWFFKCWNSTSDRVISTYHKCIIKTKIKWIFMLEVEYEIIGNYQ